SDDLGNHFDWVTNLASTATPPTIPGRISLAPAGSTGRVYVLGDLTPTGANPVNANTVWRIPDITATPPVATALTNVPTIWSGAAHLRSQRDYDQAIAVDVLSGPPEVDRIYLGGNYVYKPPVASPDNLVSSLWCMDVSGGGLVPAPQISRSGAPSGGDGAS